MKILSIWQPWASLIAAGMKRFETRAWDTDYRGLLFIHASKGGLSARQVGTLWSDADFMALAEKLGPIMDLPRGQVLCVATLAACLPTHECNPSYEEETLGDWRAGRFAWQLDNVRAFYPVPLTGRQGLFSPSRQEEIKLRDAMQKAVRV